MAKKSAGEAETTGGVTANVHGRRRLSAAIGRVGCAMRGVGVDLSGWRWCGYACTTTRDAISFAGSLSRVPLAPSGYRRSSAEIIPRGVYDQGLGSYIYDCGSNIWMVLGGPMLHGIRLCCSDQAEEEGRMATDPADSIDRDKHRHPSHVYLELRSFREYAAFVALVRGEAPGVVPTQPLQIHIVIRNFREYVEFIAVTRGQVLDAEQLNALQEQIGRMKSASGAVETSLGTAPKQPE